MVPIPASRIFAYGTLAAKEVMEALLGRLPRAAPAVLEGYARHPVRGRAYPGVVAQPGSHTRGLLYEGLEFPELALLDHFEGSLYVRRSVAVRCGASGYVGAEAYVVPEERRHLLSPGHWDLERFRRAHLREYVRHCAGLSRPSAESYPLPEEEH